MAINGTLKILGSNRIQRMAYLIWYKVISKYKIIMSRPTIQTTLLGRLGNQLFTYSATRVMALESGCQLVLTGDALERFHAKNRLGCFHLPDDVLFKEDKSFNFVRR